MEALEIFRMVAQEFSGIPDEDAVDENGKVLGMFAPTGNIPSFFHDFKAKGVPVDESVFLKGAVKLDENGEPVLPNTPPPPPGA